MAKVGREPTLAGRGDRGDRSPPPSRRRLAIAVLAILGAALAVLGVAGVVRYGQTYWMYRGFPAPLVEPGVPAPTVQTITVASPALDGYGDTVDVVLPPGYARDPRRRYPVLYLLHGSPGRPEDYLGVSNVQETLASLVAERKVEPMILVMPSGGRSFIDDDEWANGVRPGNQWETFVARDLVNDVDARYRTIRAGDARALAGLSMGGYGALNIGLHHPGEFGLLESWSGYMLASDLPAVFGHSRAGLRYNSPLDQIVPVAGQLRASRTYIWFYSGSSDYYIAQDRAFAARLAALGIAHDYFEVPGRHDWLLWRTMMPQALITASRQLSDG